MYEIVVKKKVMKYLESLPNNLQQRIGNRLDELRLNPFPSDASKLKGIGGAVLRVRVGDHRIVYYVRQEDSTVYVMIIDKRGRVYDRI